MASILKVDEIKERSVGSGITLGHALKNSSGTEIMNAAGVFSSNIDGGTISNATLDSSVTFPAGHVIQVKSFTKDDTSSSISSNTWANLGLEVTISNVKSNSKILVSYVAHLSSTTGAYQVFTRLQRITDPDGSPTTNEIAIGNSANYATASASGVSDSNTYQNNTNSFLDTPAFAGSIKYKVQSFTQSGGPVIYLNRTHYGITAASPVLVSTITVMEIAQ